MKAASTLITAAFVAGLSLPAAAQDPGKMAETVGNSLTTAPAAWLGDAPHFVMMGTVNGTVFNVQMMDMTAAAFFGAKREYRAIEGGFAYIDFEVALEAEIGGIERQIEVEMENADFTTQALPADFALQQAEFPAGLLSNLETQWEWEAKGASFNEEVVGWTGTLHIHSDTGTRDARGLSGDGTIAGYINAVKGTDTMVISFTAPVAEYEIDD